jgi:hypothetical protein
MDKIVYQILSLNLVVYLKDLVLTFQNYPTHRLQTNLDAFNGKT